MPLAPRRPTVRDLVAPMLVVALGLALGGPLPADADPGRGLALPRIDLDVPLALQSGEQANCGPTAAAMLLAAYRGLEGPSLDALRDEVGAWSWERFPMRSWHLPGRSGGMTTASMVGAILDHFGAPERFSPLAHEGGRSGALFALTGAVSTRRPVLALVEAPILWGTHKPGLHWIVVRGFEGDRVVFNDPADGKRWKIRVESFLSAWHLSAVYRAIPGIQGYTAFVADREMPWGLVASL
ncbi:MAG: C39 family peptidase [Deltaproteobacteria bacterium]|nr:C39 family peptidase [Deltaproteobacteria bacterium]MCB9786721.1 C39 family peptidase [Deltaproteobacteria bacterium]